VLFVDLVKAYDTVNRKLLWKILEKFGILPQMIKALQKLYMNATYHMTVVAGMKGKILRKHLPGETRRQSWPNPLKPLIFTGLE
jgi:hypothetical protein